MKHSLIAIFSVALLAACGNEAPPRAAATQETQETQARESAAPEPAAHSNITDDMLLGVWRTDAPGLDLLVIEFKPSPDGLLILMGNRDGFYVPTEYKIEITGNRVEAPIPGAFSRLVGITLEYNASNQTLVHVYSMSTVPPGTVFRRVSQ